MLERVVSFGGRNWNIDHGESLPEMLVECCSVESVIFPDDTCPQSLPASERQRSNLSVEPLEPVTMKNLRGREGECLSELTCRSRQHVVQVCFPPKSCMHAACARLPPLATTLGTVWGSRRRFEVSPRDTTMLQEHDVERDAYWRIALLGS